MPIANRGIACLACRTPLQPYEYEIRDLREDDVLVEVHYCGICHSDIHKVKGDWGDIGIFPMVPGHEFTGVVIQTGCSVTKHAVGDRVGIGCLVSSCEECGQCKRDLEQYCKHKVLTYNDRMPDGETTYGGYGKYVVCREDFVLKIPDSLPLDFAAPLLCAGITTYSPCRHHKFERGGLKVGVVGLGGLGHMAVQWAVSMGNEVIVLSRTTKKRDLALELGASDLIAVSDNSCLDKYKGTLNYMIDTVAADKPMDLYLALLEVDGVLITVGAPDISTTLKVPPFGLIMQRKTLQGSAIGGIAETQEMLNYAAEKNIRPRIELIVGDYVNEAYERAIKGDVHFRFVIDSRTTHA